MQKQLVNILLVDDRPEGIFTLESVLASDEYNLVKASSGQEALKCILDEEFALVLMDVQMPIMDGFETANMIRERKKSRYVPIIFVTAISKDEQYVGKGYEAGAVDYLFKPINPDILRSKVAVFVDLFKKNRKIQEQAELLREKHLAEQKEEFLKSKLESLRRYENLANSVPHLIWRTSPQGRFEYFNQVWCDYTKMSVSASMKKWKKAIYFQDLPRVIKTWAEALEKQLDSFSFECRLKEGESGRYNWFWNLVVAEKDKEGNVMSWLGTSTNINERKNIEKQKASFLSIASHELRTPLTAIKSSLEMSMMLLHEKPLNFEDLRSVLAIGNESTDSINELLNEFLDFSRVESGRLSINPKPVNLSEIVTKSVESHMLKIKSIDRLKISAKIKDNLIGSFDAPRIRQVIDNILGNAIKYSPEKGMIAVNLEKVKNEVVLSVRDEGIGICPTDLKKIFHPFKRANKSDHFSGLGIGLYISSWIVKEHMGQIDVSSIVGKGSEFVVKLPLQAKGFQ